MECLFGLVSEYNVLGSRKLDEAFEELKTVRRFESARELQKPMLTS